VADLTRGIQHNIRPWHVATCQYFTHGPPQERIVSRASAIDLGDADAGCIMVDQRLRGIDPTR